MAFDDEQKLNPEGLMVPRGFAFNLNNRLRTARHSGLLLLLHLGFDEACA
jgi:hypothetical protein